jgi:hypothetical protein
MQNGMITISGMDKDESQSEEDALSQKAKPGEFNALETLSAQDAQKGANSGVSAPKVTKKQSALRRFWGFFNIYLLIFFLLLVIAAIVFIVSYINNQREPELPTAGLQDLTQEQLSEIATGDANVGDPRYVLNIQSDAVFAGNALIRGDLNVAGSTQLGGALTIPDLDVTDTTSLNTLQIDEELNIQGTTIMQDTLTVQDEVKIRDDLSVGGSGTFNGPLTSTSLTTGTLRLAGNGQLILGNHLVITGSTPSRSNGGSIGTGGSSSVSGSDSAGQLTINTGSAPSSGCQINLAFVTAFDGAPHVQITPTNSNASREDYYVGNKSSNGFSVCFGTAPTAGRTYTFDYWVIN